MRRAAVVHGHCLDQRPIQREQIDILERRRLVQYLMGRRRRHEWVHRSVQPAEQNRRWITLLLPVLTRKNRRFHAACPATMRNRKILAASGYAWQHEMPPPLGMVDEGSPGRS